MIRSSQVLIAFALFVSASKVFASSDETRELIDGCKELVSIYEKRNEKRLFAGITTSVSEALRAGYCMGVIKQYIRDEYCLNSGWYSMAEYIAKNYDAEMYNRSVGVLLKKACK